MKQTLFFILVFMAAIKANAQDNNDPIFRLSKKKLISEVEKEIKKGYPNFEAKNFERIELRKSNRGNYNLSFSHPINYVPLEKAYYYDLGIKFALKDLKLVSQSLSAGTLSSSSNLSAESFFKNTKAIKATTDIIIGKIKEKEGKDWKITENGRLDIKEQKDVYDIWWIEELFEVYYTLNKSTHQLEWKYSADIARRPSTDEEEKWEILNWN